MHRGRFAPTPSGLLHFGSIVAAVGSYLSVKSKGGLWRLRIDDLDPPRVQQGAADGIQFALEALGLYWDGPVVFQSERLDIYEDLMQQLIATGSAYPCDCSRKQIQQTTQKKTVDGGLLYPQTCLHKPSVPPPSAWRIHVADRIISWKEPQFGPQSFSSQRDFGDFILRRKDGVFSYHLANICDDRDMDITEVIRGKDLMESSARHIYLQQSLGLFIPNYRHLPVATSPNGQKLSKQFGAKPVATSHPQVVMKDALFFLGIDVAPHTQVEEMLKEAIALWPKEEGKRKLR